MKLWNLHQVPRQEHSSMFFLSLVTFLADWWPILPWNVGGAQWHTHTHICAQFSATYGAFTTTKHGNWKWHPENRRRFRIWKPSIHFLNRFQGQLGELHLVYSKKKSTHTQFQPWGCLFSKTFFNEESVTFCLCRFPAFCVNFLLGLGKVILIQNRRPKKPKLTGQLTEPASHEYLPRHEALGRGGLWKP